jgi:hypothetical protein
MRWKLLTNLPLDATSAQRALGGLEGSGLGLISGSFTGLGGIGGGNGSMNLGPIAGGSSALGGVGGEGAGGVGGGIPGRGGSLPTAPAGAVIGGPNSPSGMGGGMGAAPMGAGMGMGAAAAQAHRRRVPYDADDPFDTGQKASPPVIGL